MSAVVTACLAAALIAAVVMMVRQRRTSVRLRGRVAVLEGGQRLRDEELMHLVNARLPALAESLYGRQVHVPGPLHSRLTDTPYGQHLDKVTHLVIESAQRAKIDAEESAKATLKSMMRGVQSLANEQQLVISRMQAKHDDPDVLDGLLRIDHMNAQLGRRAQASAVLCGSWPGLQRSASTLTDVVRGATSRIRDYLRVQVHAQTSEAVVSRAVEPVVLAIAELLDNAARHSQPNTPVDVSFRSAHNGMAVIIDDAGVAMNAEELKRAERLLSGQENVEINRLGDPPQVGFAVIGVLAARYGFSVSVDTRSPYGGVRAVLFLPTALLTRIEDTEDETAAPEPAGAAAGDVGTPELTASGLPRRRRVSAAARTAASTGASTGEPEGTEGAPERPPSAQDSDPPVPPEQPDGYAKRTAAGLGAWQRGTRSGRATVSPDSEGTSQA